MIHQDDDGKFHEFVQLRQIPGCLEKLQPPTESHFTSVEEIKSAKSLLYKALAPWIEAVWHKFEAELVLKHPGSHGLMKRGDEGELVVYRNEELHALFSDTSPEAIQQGLDAIKVAMIESFRHITTKAHVLMHPRCQNSDNPFSEQEFLEVMDLMSIDTRHNTLDCPTSLIYNGLVTSTNANVWMMRQIALSLQAQDVTEFFTDETNAQAFIGKIHRQCLPFIRYLSTMRIHEFTGIISLWIDDFDDTPIFWIDRDASLYTRSNFTNRTFTEIQSSKERVPKLELMTRDGCPAHDAGIIKNVLEWSTGIFHDLLLMPLASMASMKGKPIDPRRLSARDPEEEIVISAT
ncbi:MAG: hypothetical protein AB7H97_02095 [Pseudobdellovibrionaceae bacterium]